MATKRTLSLEGDTADSDSSPNKRHRINNEAELAPSFSNLPNDCKVHSLTFLGFQDMNSFAECNKECHQIRAHESLDQERTGTIVWTENTAPEAFCNKLRQVQDKFYWK